MRFRHILILLIIFSIFSACRTEKLKEEVYECDYSNCNTVEPQSGELEIKLTINSENQQVPVYIYRGNFEDNIVVDTIISEDEFFKFDVSLNCFYTAVAKYIKVNDTIMVIDGTEIKKLSGYNCDSLCWTVTGGKINLKLKY